MFQNIIDKIVNHLVSYYFIIRVFENSLIDENIATRLNKGTYYGLILIKKYLNEFKNKDFYILKFDISKYFFNIDYNICKEILKTKIKDKDVLNIVYKIIDSINKLPNYKKGKGLPIGNMSSQILALLYLNELDHYIKETLKVHYIRYMDDGILIHKSKEYLKYCLEEITKIVHKYKLELNHIIINL